MCAWGLEYFTHLTALKENNLLSHYSPDWTYNFFALSSHSQVKFLKYLNTDCGLVLNLIQMTTSRKCFWGLCVGWWMSVFGTQNNLLIRLH